MITSLKHHQMLPFIHDDNRDSNHQAPDQIRAQETSDEQNTSMSKKRAEIKAEARDEWQHKQAMKTNQDVGSECSLSRPPAAASTEVCKPRKMERAFGTLGYSIFKPVAVVVGIDTREPPQQMGGRAHCSPAQPPSRPAAQPTCHPAD